MRVRTPCVARCDLNENNICIGCGRTIEEIVRWNDQDRESQLQIVSDAKERKASLQPPKSTRKITPKVWREVLGS